MNALLQVAHGAAEHVVESPKTTSTADPTMVAAFLTFCAIFLVVYYVLVAIALASIFKKAGIHSRIAWIPFYNHWKLLEIGGQPGYWSVFIVVPIAQFVSLAYTYLAMHSIGKKFGKSGAFVWLGIFYTYGWFVWLADKRLEWDESLGEPSRAIEHKKILEPKFISSKKTVKKKTT